MLRKTLTSVTRNNALWRAFSQEGMVGNISSTLSGIQNINYVEEFDSSLTEADKAGKKQFLVYRSDPSNADDEPRLMSYWVDLSQCGPMYLDVLVKIKDEFDSSLSFRRSCREGICGSCSMNLDGLHSLACIRAIDTDISKPAYISPLGHMFVLRDLVVDMTNFYTQYKSIHPYLMRKTEKPADGPAEFYQNQEDRDKLDGLYECVLCASCSTSCPGYWWHPEEYLGPAVLMQAYRWIIDSRDEYTKERVEQLSHGLKLDECQNIGMCSVTCPKGLDPQK